MILAIITSYFFLSAAAQYRKSRIVPSGTKVNITEEAGRNVTVCPKRGSRVASIKLVDPFFPGFANSPKFIAVDIHRVLDRDRKETILSSYVRHGDWVVYPPNARKYGFWGIEMVDLTKKDTGIYEAIHVSTAIRIRKKMRLTVGDRRAPDCYFSYRLKI